MEKVFLGDKDVRRSPLRHLFKSNATPSDSEIIAIRALISDAEASIEELHRHLPAFDHASLVIESQLLKSIEAHKALLSPVRYLPSEILQEIFLHYADNPRHGLKNRIATMPWRLGHISHHWRKIALSLPSLWDNIPKISLSEEGLEPSYFRALVCLLRRSGSSPTLKLDIIGYHFRSPSLRKVPKSLTGIIEEIIFHSERIERLRILISDITTIHLLQGFKGRLPNLRILRLQCNVCATNLDLFETAPALRRVAIEGLYKDSSVKVLLPWSQITHFEEYLKAGRVLKLVPLSSLRSLRNLDIYGLHCFSRQSVLSLYRPTTLPNLHTLRVLIYDNDYKCVDCFLESLTIPAVEIMKILHMAPLVPQLVSMFSGSRGPSRLQKLAFRTTSLQEGELSALLKLTPHLVELNIDIPLAGDLLRLIYGEGKVILVPMLQALRLYMRIHELTVDAQIEHLNALAQVRCELDGNKDSDATTLLLGLGSRTWTTLHMLRLDFGSAKSRDQSQEILNKLSSFSTLTEDEAIDMINRCCNRDLDDIRGKSFVKETAVILSQIEYYETTNKILHVSLFWMFAYENFTIISFMLYSSGDKLHFKLRRYCIGILMKLPDEDILKQRFIDLLAEWDQLLNDFSCWARTSSGLCDSSLVYLSKSKLHGERFVLAQTVKI